MYDVEIILVNRKKKIVMRLSTQIAIDDIPHSISEAEFVKNEIINIGKSFDGFDIRAYQTQFVFDDETQKKNS